MINKDDEIKKLFDYSDLLVNKKTKKVLRDLKRDKNNIVNKMDKKGILDFDSLFIVLLDRDLEAIQKIVNYQVYCDLHEISLPLTKNISDKIYLRAKSRLNILNNTIKKFEGFWTKNENQIIIMKSQYNNKLTNIINNARIEIRIHRKNFEMEISNPKKIKAIDDITNNNQESNKIEENIKEPNIFLSYSHKDKEIADRIDDFFISKKFD